MVTENRKPTESSVRMMVEWRLKHEVDYTREAIIKRARSLADRLTQLANRLEDNPDYTFNTMGELQGNGVELDGWCMKLGFARETLRDFRLALEEDTNADRP